MIRHSCQMKTSTDRNCTCEGSILKTNVRCIKLIIFISFSVNEIIKERSRDTAVTFIYLSPPPRLDSPEWERSSVKYLELLNELTVDLPPTILVHGTDSVTSTAL